MMRKGRQAGAGRPGTDPVIGNLSPGDLTESQPRAWIGREGDGGSPSLLPPSPPGHPATAVEERHLGQSLGALIREDGEPLHAIDAIPGGGLSPMAVGHPLDPWREDPPPRSRAPSRGGAWRHFGRLLDLLGMTLVLLLYWVAYQTFLALPEAPDVSPWALLGSARINDPISQRQDQAAITPKALPPIGQFDFGQTVVTDSQPALPGLITHKPVELYRSIYELEEAFEAKYVPPAGCSGLATESGVDITACINHRLGARRAFLASNGRTMEPEEPITARRPPRGTEMEGEEDWR